MTDTIIVLQNEREEAGTMILKEKEPFTAGINYTSKKILQAAVIFLGFGMNLSQILAGGKQSADHNFHDHNIAYHCIYFI